MKISIEEKRAYDREWYKNNREKRYKSNSDNKKRIKAWFDGYRDSLSCVECGESDSSCLDFHHINPEEKGNSIVTLVHNARSIDSIISEIKTCIVLCANCHRKLHHKLRKEQIVS